MVGVCWQHRQEGLRILLNAYAIFCSAFRSRDLSLDKMCFPPPFKAGTWKHACPSKLMITMTTARISMLDQQVMESNPGKESQVTHYTCMKSWSME